MPDPKGKRRYNDQTRIDPVLEEQDQRFEEMLRSRNSENESGFGNTTDQTSASVPAADPLPPAYYLFDKDISLFDLSTDLNFAAAEIWKMNGWYFIAHSDFNITKGSSLLLPVNPSGMPAYLKPAETTATQNAVATNNTSATNTQSGDVQSGGTKDITLGNTSGNVNAGSGNGNDQLGSGGVSSNTAIDDAVLLKLQEAERKQKESDQEQRDLQKAIDPNAPMSITMQGAVNWTTTLKLFRDANAPIGDQLKNWELIRWVKICLRDGWLPSDPIPLAREVKELTPKENGLVYSTCSFDLAFAYGRKNRPGTPFFWYYNIKEELHPGPSNTELSPPELWANVDLIADRTVNYELLKKYGDKTLYDAVMKISPDGKDIRERYKSQAFFDLVKSAQTKIYLSKDDAAKIDGHYTVQFELDLNAKKAQEEIADLQQKAAASQQAYDDKYGKLNPATGLTRYVRDGKELLINADKYSNLLEQIDAKDVDGVLAMLEETGLKNPGHYLCLLDYNYRLNLLNLFADDSNYTADSELMIAITVAQTQKDQYGLIGPALKKNNNQLFGKLRILFNDSPLARRVYQSYAELIMGITDFGEYSRLINASPSDQAEMILGMSNRDLAVLSWNQRDVIMDNVLNSESYPESVEYLITSTPVTQKEDLRLKIFYGDYQSKLTALMNSDQRKHFYAVIGAAFPDQINDTKLDKIGTGDASDNGTIATELTPKEMEVLDSSKRIDLIIGASYDEKYFGTFGGLGDASMQAIIDLINATSGKKRVISTTVTDYEARGPFIEDENGKPIRPRKTISTQTDRSDQDDLRDFFIYNNGEFLTHLYDEFSGKSLDDLRKSVGALFVSDVRLISAVNDKVAKNDANTQQLAWFLTPAILDQMSGQSLLNLLNVVFVAPTMVTNPGIGGFSGAIPVTNPFGQQTDDKMETLGIDILHSINTIPAAPTDKTDPDYNKKMGLYTAAMLRKGEFITALKDKPGVVYNMFFEATALIDETNLYGMKKEFFNLVHDNSATDAQIKKAEAGVVSNDDNAVVQALAIMDDTRLAQIKVWDRLRFVRQICLIDKSWWDEHFTAVGDEKEQLIISLFRTTPPTDSDNSNIANGGLNFDYNASGNSSAATEKKSDINTMLDALTENGGALYTQIASVIHGSEFAQFHDTIKKMGMLRAIGLTGEEKDSADILQQQNDKINALSEQQEQGEIAGVGAKNMLLYANPGLVKQIAEWQKKYNIAAEWAKVDGKDKIKVTSYIKYPGQEYTDSAAASAMQFDQKVMYFDPYEMVGILHLIRDSDRGINHEGQIEYMLAINLFNLQNAQNKQTAWQVIDVVLLVLSVIPVTAPVAWGLRGLRLVLAIVDVVVATTMVILDSYRSDLASTAAGRNFLNFFDMLMMVYAAAGVIRLGQMLADPKTYERFVRLLSGAKAVAKSSLSKLDQWLQSILKVSEEGGPVDNALADAQKTGTTTNLGEKLKGAGLSDETANYGKSQSNIILKDNPGGANDAIISKTGTSGTAGDVWPPPNKPQAINPKGNGGGGGGVDVLAPPKPGVKSNILLKVTKEQVKGIDNMLQEVAVFKSDGQLIQIERRVLDGSEVTGVKWTYTASGALVGEGDLVMSYVGKTTQFESTISTIQPTPTSAVQPGGAPWVEVETAEGIAGRFRLQTQINTGGTTQTDVNTGGANQTQVNTGGTTQTDVNTSGSETQTNTSNSETQTNTSNNETQTDNSNSQTQTDNTTTSVNTDVTGGTTSNPTNTGGLTIYKISEPDGITYYKNGKAFKKGTDGKYYEQDGSQWKLRDDITSDAELEAILDEKLNDFKEKTAFESSEPSKPVTYDSYPKLTPDTEAQLRIKLKKQFKLSDGDIDKLIQQLKDEGGGELLAQRILSGKYDKFEGFDKLVSSIQMPNQGIVTKVNSALDIADEMIAQGYSDIYFERSIPDEGIDIDVGGKSPAGKDVVFQMKLQTSEGIKAFWRNLNGAYGQLSKLSSEIEKWLEIKLKNISSTDFIANPEGETKLTGKLSQGRYTGVNIRIIFSDGITKIYP